MRRTKAEVNHEIFTQKLKQRFARPLTVDTVSTIAGLHAVSLANSDGTTVQVTFDKANITFVRDDTRQENGYANYKNVHDAFNAAIVALGA